MGKDNLGRDFWLYRGGQAVSVIGDSCGLIAMSWWILTATGSAAKMSYIMAPMLLARIVLLPLFGPLGDRFARKRLIIAGDAWRGLLCLVLSAMAYSGFFNIWAVTGVYVLMGGGSALFSAGASAITPNLVSKENLQLAMQRGEAVNSAGQILGGAIGGILVSVLGVGGAFLADGVSFLAAAAASGAIAADTKPPASGVGNSLAAWAGQLGSGLRAMRKVPTLFWLGVFAAFINFAFSPINVGLPVLVKQIRNMPPWFLGALESSVSAGVILGSFCVGWLMSRFRGDKVMVCGTVVLGLSLAALPHAPTAVLPVFVMFCLGLMLAVINIPLSTRQIMATPDHFRARLGSVVNFMCGAMTPLGVAAAGFSISRFSLNATFLAGGLTVAAAAPLLLLIPGFSALLTITDEETHDYFARRHPEAFSE